MPFRLSITTLSRVWHRGSPTLHAGAREGCGGRPSGPRAGHRDRCWHLVLVEHMCISHALWQPPLLQKSLAPAVKRQPWLPPGTHRASCHQREWYKRERTLLAKHRSRDVYTDAGFSVLTPSAALYRKSRALSEMREIILHRLTCTSAP